MSERDGNGAVATSERLAQASAGPARDVPRGHVFDQIQEYDNEVPRWLAWIFHGSVIWAILYVAYFHLGHGQVGAEAYRQEQMLINERLAAQSEGLPGEDVLRHLSHNAERIAAGKELFFGPGLCTQCHGRDGKGLTGPNLRDDRWLHGSDMSEIVATIAEGSPNGQMPPNNDKFSQQEIINLAAYIADWNRSAKAADGVNRDGETHDPIDY